MGSRLLIRQAIVLIVPLTVVLLGLPAPHSGRLFAQSPTGSSPDVDGDQRSSLIYPLRSHHDVIDIEDAGSLDDKESVGVAQYSSSIYPPTPDQQSASVPQAEPVPTGPLGIQDVFPLFRGDSSLQGVPPISDPTLPYGLVQFTDYESFRGVPDGVWGNNGIHVGFNAASSLGKFSELTGIGVQAGGSVGVFDWTGTDYRAHNQDGAETQGFFTYGLYRKPTEGLPITAGLVQDWSVNHNFGVFGQSPTLSQLRAQLGYATSASNEFGIWGTAHVLSSTHDVTGFGPVKWQSINQISGYWHHKWFAGGPDSWLSVGAPASSRLAGGGSIGDYLVSASAVAPFSDAVSLYSSVTYMHQSSHRSIASAGDDAWDFIVGVNIYPFRNSRSSTVAGQRWMPLLSVANNGSFLVDSSQSF
ncbi:MAG: Conserved putative secreted protein [Planctomycetaceae bacterium]|nr:Conserved putative secreted protein [Planctomycetaceae bacterium]